MSSQRATGGNALAGDGSGVTCGVCVLAVRAAMVGETGASARCVGVTVARPPRVSALSFASPWFAAQRK